VGVPAVRRLVVLSALAVLASGATGALAGGVDFDLNAQSTDLGPPYLGVVTDQNGAPIPDAKIAITTPKLGRTLIQRADSQGHFFVQPFDKSINPKDVNITCLKEGYTVATATKTITASPDTPVDAVCILHKQ
jgi:hypothetical protein